MQTVKFRLKDGTTSQIIKGVMLLESSDLFVSFKHPLQKILEEEQVTSKVSTAAQEAKDVGSSEQTTEQEQSNDTLAEQSNDTLGVQSNTTLVEQSADSFAENSSENLASFKEGAWLSSSIKARSFASLQWRAKNAVRSLFAQKNERLLVLASSTSIDGISTAVDLVREVTGFEASIAYAPTKFELFGSDKDEGLLTTTLENDGSQVVVMPCAHLNDHPKWLGMMDACLAQNQQLKLILCGDATDVATLSMMWPTLDNAIHADIVLEFPSDHAIEIIAGLISHYQKQDPLLPSFSYEAVELLAQVFCRFSGDRRYIGLLELKLQSVIYEAANYARNLKSNQDLEPSLYFVSRRCVLKAISAQDFRANFLAESSLRDHRDKQLLVATQGAVIGQINGLSVIETLGTSYEYGEPVRITATMRAGGEGDVIDIERKAELAGQIHAKAMMIINGFLTKEFGSEQPLPVSASLVFEQSYSEVDGDSASLTGLCAVISGLASVPIRQDLAVTGAVDQFGDVQAVGGVNEKIEGFFRVCRLHGFTGTQGVIIPSSCVNQLVLRPAVVKAVEEGKFHIFTVSHVVDAVKLLTTVDWGDSETENTICYRINERLNNILAIASEPSWYENIVEHIKNVLPWIKNKQGDNKA